MSASKTAKQDVTNYGQKRQFVTIGQFANLGANHASMSFSTKQSQQKYFDAWISEWSDLPTAQMPAVRSK